MCMFIVKAEMNSVRPHNDELHLTLLLHNSAVTSCRFSLVAVQEVLEPVALEKVKHMLISAR